MTTIPLAFYSRGGAWCPQPRQEGIRQHLDEVSRKLAETAGEVAGGIERMSNDVNQVASASRDVARDIGNVDANLEGLQGFAARLGDSTRLVEQASSRLSEILRGKAEDQTMRTVTEGSASSEARSLAGRWGVAALGLAALAAGCAVLDDGGTADGDRTATRGYALNAYCQAQVNGVGVRDVETDYLPHVITCENGGADDQALRAQAVSARSYLYYKLETSGAVADGTGDQVYTCGRQPEQRHYDAVAATSGEVLTYQGHVICGFFVAGAIPGADSCVATGNDRDPTGTEHFVTYNWQRSGDGIDQTTLGWVNAGNYRNRGCMSQNGSNCLSQHGWVYGDIEHFYYGMDAQLERAAGDCVHPPEPVQPDAGTPGEPDSGVAPDSGTPADAGEPPPGDEDAGGPAPTVDSGSGTPPAGDDAGTPDGPGPGPGPSPGGGGDGGIAVGAGDTSTAAVGCRLAGGGGTGELPLLALALLLPVVGRGRSGRKR